MITVCEGGPVHLFERLAKLFVIQKAPAEISLARTLSSSLGSSIVCVCVCVCVCLFVYAYVMGTRVVVVSETWSVPDACSV